MFLIFRQIIEEPPQFLTLKREEIGHIRARRLQEGALVAVGDGCSRRWMGYLQNDLHSIEILPGATQRQEPLRILCPAMPKGSRLDWLVEKAVELGVTHLQFVIYDHSVRRSINEKRLERLIESAASQAQRLFLPQLLAPISAIDLPGRLESLLQEGLPQRATGIEEREKQVLLLHPQPTKERASASSRDARRISRISIRDICLPAGMGAAVAAGPEGGFSRKEISLFQSQNYSFVHLSDNILRIETACLAALALMP